MWNLLSLGVISTIYKPTAYTDTNSITTNEDRAYDASLVTFSTAIQSSSGSDGVVLEQSTTYHTFATLSKTDFSDVVLEVVASAYAYSGSATGDKIVTSCILLDYSVDGGSSYINFYTLSSGWSIGGVITNPGYPPTIVTIPGGSPVTSGDSYITIVKDIPSSSFTTGLQDLYIRVRLATNRISSSSGQFSEAKCYVNGISAMVS